MIFLVKGENVHPRIIGTNLVTRYRFSAVSCVIPKKSEYTDDDTWVNVVKVLAPGIRK